MKTSPASKSSRATTVTRSTRRCSNEIAWRAAAVMSKWSADERNQRAGLAEQLQCWLLASIGVAAVPMPEVAYARVR